MSAYEVIVIGCGGVGSAALYHLARRGVRALGLDRFPPGHDRGSSHGETRIIRQAYFEHPDYVPLAISAYELWAELAARTNASLFQQTGLLQVGPSEGAVVRGVLDSAARHGLAVERLLPAQVRERFPGFVVPDEMCGAFEPKAGYLRVEECVRAHAAEAQRLGAELILGESVQAWHTGPAGISVETDRARYSAGRLILAAGPWAGDFLRGLGIELEVRRKPVFWFETTRPDYQVQRGAPAFLYETEQGVFYGFPEIEGALKVAEHSGGEPVADPLAVDRALRPADRARVSAFCSRYLPAVSDRLLKHSVCMYTMSPDEHFIVDLHPSDSRVALAAGLSGHGFKFTCVLGKVLAELVLDGRSTEPVGFLQCDRPGLGKR